MNSYIETLKKYAVFKGRASRREYWTFVFTTWLIAMGIGLVEALLGTLPESGESLIVSLFQLFTVIPSIAVGVRRMHDVNKSGWYLLFPIYNLILTIRSGSKDENQYGPSLVKKTS